MVYMGAAVYRGVRGLGPEGVGVMDNIVKCEGKCTVT